MNRKLLVVTSVIIVCVVLGTLSYVVWRSASQHFLFARDLEFGDVVGAGAERYANVTDNEKVVATVHLRLDHAPPNSDDFPCLLYVSLEHTNKIEVDSLWFRFSQSPEPMSVEVADTSSVPPDNFTTSSAGLRDVILEAKDVGSYGTSNITLNIMLNLAIQLPGEEEAYYTVDVFMAMSMHEQTFLQLTSLKVGALHTYNIKIPA